MLTIEQLRQQIQDIDLDIVRSLAFRQDLSKKISRLKKQNGMQIIDPIQEKKNIDFYEFLSRQYDMDPEFLKRVFKLIMLNSRTIQQKEIQEDSG